MLSTEVDSLRRSADIEKRDAEIALMEKEKDFMEKIHDIEKVNARLQAEVEILREQHSSTAK